MLIFTLLTLFVATAPQLAHFEPVHASLTFKMPVQVLFDQVNDDVMYVVEKSGLVRRVSTQKDTTEKPVYMDITDRVGVTNDEEGLLSIAFHPKFKDNGQLFAWYSAQRPRRSVLSRFFVSQDNKEIDVDTEEILLEVLEPWANHNGGTVLFGPDGYLYLGIGDGGAANDPQKNGQNKDTLLGSIIRIDVDSPAADRPYSIPKDNPLVGADGCREELWAWGLRNVWRMSFDRETGELWTGDVGQNSWEEIDIIVKGGNYGWNVREGTHAFRGGGDSSAMIEPVHEYGRRSGGSITGGHVYRGSSIPALVGGYVFSDYMSKKIWVLFSPKEGEEKYIAVPISEKTPLAISSFGETPDGEILACGFWNAYAVSGKIYRLVSPLVSTESNSD